MISGGKRWPQYIDSADPLSPTDANLTVPGRSFDVARLPPRLPGNPQIPTDRPAIRSGYTCNLVRRGFFVSFEGLDGCGKTTQINRLAARLHTLGITPVVAQEPGGTRLGCAIRALLLDSTNSDLQPMPELLLYFASRAQNLAEVILPALEADRVVLCDRFTDASVAYQGYGRDLGMEPVRRLSAVACEGMQTDLTLWLDIDPETALARARTRNELQDRDEGRMEAETLAFFLRVRRGYADLHQAEPHRVRRIDGGGTANSVAQAILETVLPAIRSRGLLGRS